MKQKMLVILVALSIVTMVFSTAASPYRGLSFGNMIYVPSKGFVATFEPDGKWRQDDLWGFVMLPNDAQINMDCNFRDDGKISCVIADGIAQYQGRHAKIVLYGFAFDITVPYRSASTAEYRGLSFDSITYTPSKGYLAIFEPRGNWHRDELKGFVSLPHDAQINMDCNFRDDGKIGCVIADGIAQYQGRYVKLVLYGYDYDVALPKK